jgi:hypothetical protein
MTDSPAARLDRAVLERAASNTLREKFAGRLFDKKYDGTSDGEWGNTAMCRASSKGGVLDAPEHRALARRAAQEGTVLLVNGGDGPSYGWRPGGSGRATPSPPAPPPHVHCVPPAKPCHTHPNRCCKTEHGVAEPAAVGGGSAGGEPTLRGQRGRRTFTGSSLSLPLTADKWKDIKQLAIVGPNANISQTVLGSYVSAWGEYPPGTKNAEIRAETVLKSARAAVPSATKIVSAALDSDSLIDVNTMGANQTRLIEEAVAAASASDVVVAVLGDSAHTCGEGNTFLCVLIITRTSHSDTQ